MWELTLQIEELSDCWFVTGAPVPENLKSMADYIISAGSYGTIQNVTQKRLEKLQKKYKHPFVRAAVYWIQRICCPMDEMSKSYPILNKIPVLLPLFWIIRAVMKFTKHPKEIWHHVRIVFGKGGKNG